MRIIISPAKKMREDEDAVPAGQLGTPVFLARAEELCAWMSGLSYEEQKRLWACSDKIARQGRERLERIDLRRHLTPALLAYDGIQYTYMAPSVFEDGEVSYVQEHVRILSGLYGVLRPLDGVASYRLEMQAKATVAGCANLYEYWGDLLYREVMGPDRVLVNLASKEYAKAVERNLAPGDRLVSCVFGELVEGRVVQKGVYVKMARGEMVRYLTSIHAERPERMRDFSWSGYRFCEERSTEREYVFVRTR